MMTGLEHIYHDTYHHSTTHRHTSTFVFLFITKASNKLNSGNVLYTTIACPDYVSVYILGYVNRRSYLLIHR